jgi:hypothetical protein
MMDEEGQTPFQRPHIRGVHIAHVAQIARVAVRTVVILKDKRSDQRKDKERRYAEDEPHDDTKIQI